MDEEMIERVAKALAFEFRDDNKYPDALKYAEEHWRDYYFPAKAAISKMREPTERMVRAGQKFATPGSSLGRVARTFNTMIDAALAE